MGIIKTKGIVLLESNMGDFDKMVSILTPDIGKIGCAAKGARRPKSSLLAGTQFLSFSVLLKKNKNGLDKCIRKIGKRLYIRIDLFDNWIESQAI